jgi:hypothetical protein
MSSVAIYFELTRSITDHSFAPQMADDIAQRLEEENVVKNPAGTAECLVDPDRRMVAVGLGKADNPSAISARLVREVRGKALPLKLFFAEPGTRYEFPGYGQAGFIRRALIQSSPGGSTPEKYSVYPITAKHNLRQFHNKEKNTFSNPLQQKSKCCQWDKLIWPRPILGGFPREMTLSIFAVVSLAAAQRIATMDSI